MVYYRLVMFKRALIRISTQVAQAIVHPGVTVTTETIGRPTEGMGDTGTTEGEEVEEEGETREKATGAEVGGIEGEAAGEHTMSSKNRIQVGEGSRTCGGVCWWWVREVALVEVCVGGG